MVRIAEGRRPMGPCRGGMRGLVAAGRGSRTPAVAPDQVLRRAGLLKGDGLDEGFWELWGVWKRLTLRFAQDCAAGEREAVVDFALFQEGRRG